MHVLYFVHPARASEVDAYRIIRTHYKSYVCYNFSLLSTGMYMHNMFNVASRQP